MMEHTFAATLKSLSSFFPENLISAGEFGKLIKISEKFPQFFSPGAGFESRLGERNPSLDFFFSVEKENRSIPAGNHPELTIDKSLFSNTIWQSIQRFCEEWSIPDSSMDRYVNKLFFEFDVGGYVSNIPVPAVFMQIDESMYQLQREESELVPKTLERSDCEWIFKALSILKNGSITTKTLEKAWTCFENLVPGTYIDHIAIMASRSPDVMRINITDFQQDTLYQYLDRIGLAPQISQLHSFVSKFCRFADYMVLALDVGETIYPRIGIEFRLPKDNLHLSTQRQWHPFFDYLVEQNLCTKEKRDGFVNWSGRSRDIFDPELYRYYIYRYINLIKAVYVPQKPLEIKGYFSFLVDAIG